MNYDIQLTRPEARRNKEVYYRDESGQTNVDILYSGGKYRVRMNRNTILRTRKWSEVYARLCELIENKNLHLVLEDRSIRALEPIVKNGNPYKPVVW